jgi:hypothetical protein
MPRLPSLPHVRGNAVPLLVTRQQQQTELRAPSTTRAQHHAIHTPFSNRLATTGPIIANRCCASRSVRHLCRIGPAAHRLHHCIAIRFDLSALGLRWLAPRANRHTLLIAKYQRRLQWWAPTGFIPRITCSQRPWSAVRDAASPAARTRLVQTLCLSSTLSHLLQQAVRVLPLPNWRRDLQLRMSKRPWHLPAR